MQKKISASLEDYLEAIYNLHIQDKPIKVTEIAAVLKVNKASVSEACKSLSKFKLINYAPYSEISLTIEGQKIAKEIVYKHDVLNDFFINILNIEEEEAKETACKIEHIISENVLSRIVNFIDFTKNASCKEKVFLKEFRNFYEKKEKE